MWEEDRLNFSSGLSSLLKGELTIADCFKQASMIALISIATVYIAGIFIKF